MRKFDRWFVILVIGISAAISTAATESVARLKFELTPFPNTNELKLYGRVAEVDAKQRSFVLYVTSFEFRGKKGSLLTWRKKLVRVPAYVSMRYATDGFKDNVAELKQVKTIEFKMIKAGMNAVVVGTDRGVSKELNTRAVLIFPAPGDFAASPVGPVVPYIKANEKELDENDLWIATLQQEITRLKAELKQSRAEVKFLQEKPNPAPHSFVPAAHDKSSPFDAHFSINGFDKKECRYDAELPGYHLTGTNPQLRIQARTEKLPQKLVLVINSTHVFLYFKLVSPSITVSPQVQRRRINREHSFMVCENEVVSETNSISSEKLVSEAPCGTYFRFEVVGQAIHVTLLPPAIELLKQECVITWTNKIPL